MDNYYYCTLLLDKNVSPYVTCILKAPCKWSIIIESCSKSKSNMTIDYAVFKLIVAEKLKIYWWQIKVLKSLKMYV